MLVWRVLGFPVNATEDPPFAALALLLTAVASGDEENSGRRLKKSLDGSTMNILVRDKPDRGAWLSGTTRLRDRAADWRVLSRRILARPQLPHPCCADEAIRLLGEKIAWAGSSAST